MLAVLETHLTIWLCGSAFYPHTHKYSLGLWHGNVSGQIQMYRFSPCCIFCNWTIVVHCKKCTSLRILMDWRGPFGRHWRVGWAQLHSRCVLHSMFTCFNFKGCVPRLDESNIGSWLEFSGGMSRGPSAANATSSKESECHHQKDGTNDDGRVVDRQEGPKSKCSYQSDVNTC